MKEFFATSSYQRIPAEICAGCDQEWNACQPSLNSSREFKDMTGLEWPGCVSISVPLRKDMRCLSLDCKDVPHTIALCLNCCVQYMKAFNRRLRSGALVQKARSGQGGPAMFIYSSGHARGHMNATKTRHKQVSIIWNGVMADVDEDVAPLILALWKRGIHTVNSCQENFPGIAWIQFPTALDAKRFLDLVAVYPKTEDTPFWETLYGRITNHGSDGDWQYDVNIHNWNLDEEIVNDEVLETCTGPSDFEFAVSIRFPRTDIPLICQRVGCELVMTLRGAA